MSHNSYLLGTDFGFHIKDVFSDLLVCLRYGQHDMHVPVNHGIQIAKRLGEHSHLWIEDDTYASIFFRWRKEVLADLIRNM